MMGTIDMRKVIIILPVVVPQRENMYLLPDPFDFLCRIYLRLGGRQPGARNPQRRAGKVIYPYRLAEFYGVRVSSVSVSYTHLDVYKRQLL